MPEKAPWETAEARRVRARELCQQCPGEHVVGDLVAYCQLDQGHTGDHIDALGNRFRAMFSFVGRWARSQGVTKD